MGRLNKVFILTQSGKIQGKWSEGRRWVGADRNGENEQDGKLGRCSESQTDVVTRLDVYPHRINARIGATSYHQSHGANEQRVEELGDAGEGNRAGRSTGCGVWRVSDEGEPSD